MKRIPLFFMTLFTSSTVFAQQFLPVSKNCTRSGSCGILFVIFAAGAYKIKFFV